MLFLGYFVLLAVGLNCNAAPVPCGPPPRDPEFELQGTFQESYPPGTTVTFTCRPGYSRQGFIKKTCADGNWEFIARGVCKRKSCGHPGDIEFGTFDLKEGEGFVFGAVVEYSCDEGYQMVSKQRTRECTATGWSHYPPHCEVRKCPPVEAAAGVKVITTSYDDEEFSVGQVVKFQCQNPKLKLDGSSEIFCTSEGTWSADPPQCTTITCKKPMITNGRVENPKEIYNEGEKLPFKCNKKYKPYRSEDVICNANGWSPEPLCEDISCYPDYVANGKVEKTKEIYKEGDTIVLNCNYEYQIEFSPNEPRKCTANGWFPPLKCISQTCIRPEIADGQLYYNYYFPKQLGTYIDYRCNKGFLPQDKRYYGSRSFCTDNGWDPKPKCTKTCSRYNAQVENGELQNSDDYYLVGEKVQFSCRQSYLTKDKQKNGERECLPNGKFTEDQCSKFCDVTQLPVGKYEPDKKIFVVGETLLFECNNGFVIARGKISTNIECLQTGWSTFPQCFEAKCVVKGNNLISKRRDYKIGEVAQISCPPDYTLKGSELIQCYNYGWGPELPKCEEIKCTLPRFQESNLVKDPNQLVFKVNEEVSLSCRKTLFLNGANRIRCTSDGWVPTLPVCQKDTPKPHEVDEQPGKEDTPKPHEVDEQPGKVCTIPNINNLIRSPHYTIYVVGKEVEFSCHDNFQRIGNRTSICTQDGWKPDLPTCQAENPEPTQPSTESATQEKRQKCPPAHSPFNAEIKNPKAEYYSGDTVEIECSPKYLLNGDRIILCKDGKWQSSPQCIPLQKCPKPPIIKDGEITEETRKNEYFTDDIVKYSCNPGFHITGSNESRCTERTWLAAPQCTEDPCGPPPSVTNAHVPYKNKQYKHGEYAQYVCVNNYKITEEKPATCLEGKWWHVPTCVYISCSPPPEIENGVLTGKKKDQYASGDKVRYRCNKEYAFEKKTNDKSEAICEETQWKSIPVCRKIGERCGPAPVVQYGDYLGPKQNYYKSGYTMQYKCPNFYKTEGETSVRCENGVWGDPPVCLEPCTANAKDMKENNIDFKWIAGNKLYSEHDDDMEFRCINGFEISNRTHLRVKCNRGVILYPKCTKIGSCLLSQSTMKQQNIYLNRSSEISNWETVTFECYEKMVPENVLQATCVNGKLDYPKCLFAEKCKSAPEVQNGKLKGEQNQGGYDSGSTVEFECDPQHVLSGPISVKCERGQWSDLPQCLKPCKIFTKDLNARNVELISPEDEHIYENGDEVDFKCKTGFKNINSGNPLKGECNDGKMKYPKCFQGSTCRLSQEILDEKNVELHTNENYDVYYGNGETITFKCKIGFHSTSELTGKCENQILTYPSCTFRESSV